MAKSKTNITQLYYYSNIFSIDTVYYQRYFHTPMFMIALFKILRK